MQQEFFVVFVCRSGPEVAWSTVGC